MFRNKRKAALLALILVMTLLLGTTQAAFASGEEEPSEKKGWLERTKETAFGPIKMVNNVFCSIVGWPLSAAASAILCLPGVNRMDQLVFGVGKYGEQSSVGNTFSREEWDRVLMPMYKGMFVLGTIPVLISIIAIIGGFQMLKGSLNPGKMVALQESAWNTLAAAVLVCSGPFLLWFLLELNGSLVSGIEGVITKVLGKPMLEPSTLLGRCCGQALLDKINSGSPLIDGIAKLIFAGITLQFNVLYLLRKWMLAIMLLLAPIAGWSWISKGTRTPMLLLLSEMVSNALTPAAHALVLGFYIVLLNADAIGMFREWWAKLAALFFILPLGALVKRMITGWLDILGVKEEKVAGMAAAAIGGMMTVGSIVTAMGAKGVASPAVRGAAHSLARPSIGGVVSGGGTPGTTPATMGAAMGAAGGLAATGYEAGRAVGAMLSRGPSSADAGSGTGAATASGASDRSLAPVRGLGADLGRMAYGSDVGEAPEQAGVAGHGSAATTVDSGVQPLVHVEGTAPDGIVAFPGAGPKKPHFIKVAGGVLGRGALRGTYVAGTLVGLGMGLGNRATDLGDMSTRALRGTACGGWAVARAGGHGIKWGYDRCTKFKKDRQSQPEAGGSAVAQPTPA